MHTRIAPTPSGFLHIGNACSFLLTRQLADLHGGSVRLRIDDMDSNRVRPEYLADIFEVLHLLDIDYDQGPKSVNEFQEKDTQKLQLSLYTSLLNELRSNGCIYACSCSRKLLAENQGQCYCRQNNIPLERDEVTWRITVPNNTIIRFTDDKLGVQQIDLASQLPHFAVRKRDGLPAYHITSLADDVHYHIDYIVRGYDLLTTTAVQLYIAQLAGIESFLSSRFFHHPLLTNAKGEKLSKSAGAASVSTLLQLEKDKKRLLKIVDNWLV